MNRLKKQRNEEICRLHTEGKNFRELAREFDLTETRIRQIIKDPYGEENSDQAIEVSGSAYFTCDVTDTGYHDVPEDFRLVQKIKLRLTELQFTCPACGNKHKLIFKEAEVTK